MLNDLNPYVTSFIIGITWGWIGSISLAIWLLFVYQAPDSRRTRTTVLRDMKRALFVPFRVVREARLWGEQGRAHNRGTPRNTWIRAAVNAAFVVLIGFTAWFVLIGLTSPLFTTTQQSAIGIAWPFAIPAVPIFLGSIRTFRRA